MKFLREYDEVPECFAFQPSDHVKNRAAPKNWRSPTDVLSGMTLKFNIEYLAGLGVEGEETFGGCLGFYVAAVAGDRCR